MTPYLLTISPLTAFGDSMHGDTLFGQLCWSLLHRLGENKLTDLLDSYVDGKPFAIIGNAFPSGFFPRPLLPARFLASIDDATQRKAAKKKVWIARNQIIQSADTSFAKIVDLFAQDTKTIGFEPISAQQLHNSIDRMTGTTGEAGFAPYQSEQYWFRPGTKLDIVCLIDESKMPLAVFRQALEDIGLSGYGRDASIGLGKFRVEALSAFEIPHQKESTHALSLGHLAPQGLSFDANKSFYKPFVRFGRHGSLAVTSGKPFKAPIMLTEVGSLFALTTANVSVDWLGQGIGGIQNPISNHDSRTVHQGYAPVLCVKLT